MNNKMNDERRRIWEAYVEAWKVTSREAKADALRRSLAPENVYRDPLTVRSGHSELLDYMLQLQIDVPGCYFKTTYFLTHHDASIAKWNMIAGDDSIIGEGVSYAQYNDHGMLVCETGFFETPAP